MRNHRMIQLLKKQGWLVVAAAFNIGLIACSSDDIASDPRQDEKAGTIHVTVGAGFDEDEADTRSAVVFDATKKTRTLTFTKGDKLFVTGSKDNYGIYNEQGKKTNVNLTISGYLPMVEGTLSDDAKSAQFAGDVNIQPKEYAYVLDGIDPFSLCRGTAILIHENAQKGKDYEESTNEVTYLHSYEWAKDVNTLLTTKAIVSGKYKNSLFQLRSQSSPAFNCTISGLTANASYKMTYIGDKTVHALGDPITADAEGKVTFAFFGENGNSTHTIRFENTQDPKDVRVLDLGKKKVVNGMIYNINKTAPATPVENIAVEKVEMNKPTLTLTLDETTTLVATVSPANATNPTVSWSVTDGDAVTVDQTGKVTAVKVGNATVTAKAGEKTAKCQVKVNKKAGMIQFVNKSPIQTWSATSADNTFTQTVTNTGGGKVTYSVDATTNTCGASIDEKTGKVTFTMVGSVKVSAQVSDTETYTYSANTVSYTLTVNKAEGFIKYTTIAVEKMNADNPFTNKLTIVGDGTVTYSSSKEKVATVDANTGKVTITGVGETTITAEIKDSDTYTYPQKKATYTVTVSALPSNVGRDSYEGGGNPF